MIEKCRLCGKSDEKLLNIFEENTPIPNLRLRIYANLQIMISANDQFSHSVCQICFRELQKLDAFIKVCQQTQFVLLDIKEKDSCTEEQVLSNVDEEESIFITNHSTIILDSLCSVEDDHKEVEEFEIPSKRRKLSSPLNENHVNIDKEEEYEVEAEEVEINLCDFVSDIDVDENSEKDFTHKIKTDSNLNDSENNSSSKKIPYSKLVSFFSTRVQMSKSVSENDDCAEHLANDTENVQTKGNDIDMKEDLTFETREIKTECIESEDDLRAGNSAHIFASSFHDVNVKSEEKLYESNIEKFKNTPSRTTKHTLSNLKTCPLCAHQFAPNELEDHIKFHSDDEEYLDLIISEMKEVPFKHKMHYCEECKKVFVRDSLYLEHMREHSKIKMINCHLCDNTFSIRKKLKVHLRAVHIPKNSKCDLCSYAAKTSTDLRKHIKGVHENKPIICEICGKSVSSNISNYNRHLQTHSEERSYKCELCTSSFKTAASLQKHRDNIHFPKSVMCTTCGTICGSKIKYKKHVRRCRKRMLRYG